MTRKYEPHSPFLPQVAFAECFITAPERKPEPVMLEPAICALRSPGATASCCCYDFHPDLISGLNPLNDPPFRNKLSPASHRSTSINSFYFCSTSHLPRFLRLLKCNRNLLGFASVPKGLIRARPLSPLDPSQKQEGFSCHLL